MYLQPADAPLVALIPWMAAELGITGFPVDIASSTLFLTLLYNPKGNDANICALIITFYISSTTGHDDFIMISLSFALTVWDCQNFQQKNFGRTVSDDRQSQEMADGSCDLQFLLNAQINFYLIYFKIL